VFDATETEPPNTNSFFGPGGYSVWAADTSAQKLRGCITISSGLGTDITKCLDMTFQWSVRLFDDWIERFLFPSPLVGEGGHRRPPAAVPY
jgi:hypothetical protein